MKVSYVIAFCKMFNAATLYRNGKRISTLQLQYAGDACALSHMRSDTVARFNIAHKDIRVREGKATNVFQDHFVY